MDFIVDLISDPSLMEHSNFHAVIKELFVNGKPTRMYDEPWTGQTWWDIEVPCIVFLLYTTDNECRTRANFPLTSLASNGSSPRFTSGSTKAT
jgi:hypothetical protein